MEHLTVTQAAEELNLSVPTIKRYIYSGELRSAKLPGGQHRIPRSEIDRLLTPEGESPPGEGEARDIEDRLDMIERWLSDLQAEMDCTTSTLQVLSSYCERMCGPASISSEEDERVRILILGTGCSKCDRLHELAVDTLAELGRDEVVVEHVKDPMEIADYGPVLTPALVLDDTVLVSGQVPTEAALRELLEEHLTQA